MLRYQAGYGYKERKHLANHFRLGEGLVGQCAKEKERILLTDVPGVSVGHATDERVASGVTVVLCGADWRAGVDVRGGGPGTRDPG